MPPIYFLVTSSCLDRGLQVRKTLKLCLRKTSKEAMSTIQLTLQETTMRNFSNSEFLNYQIPSPPCKSRTKKGKLIRECGTFWPILTILGSELRTHTQSRTLRIR